MPFIMRSSQELLRALNQELSQPRSVVSPETQGQSLRVSEHETSMSEHLANNLLEKVQRERQRFLSDCKRLRSKLQEALAEDTSED
mmetsp:Transcript_7763/g.11442  ORF Transcript_7763/g.11442 Transcript_7763/m.11442 type:complete len:86 (+) Transcript_7763:604-861(+)